jgi:tRNA wybutosine-synthesizing protein 1
VAFWQNNFFEKLNYFTSNLEKAETLETESTCCQGVAGSSAKNNQSSCCNSKENNKNEQSCCKTNGVGKHEDNGINNGDEIENDEVKYEDTTEDENQSDEDDNYFSENDEMLSDAGENGETMVSVEKKVKVKKNSGLVDMEDLGTVINSIKKKNSKNNPPKEMITPLLRKSLEKQGYKLIGSHSGVKLCRWTKSMLRGRGGCYKHTFYGIESHRCMETTPSLACANKCVFCWRHHTNPVGTEWVKRKKA